MTSWILGVLFGAILIILNPHKLNFFELVVICNLMAIFLELYRINNHMRKRKSYEI